MAASHTACFLTVLVLAVFVTRYFTVFCRNLIYFLLVIYRCRDPVVGSRIGNRQLVYGEKLAEKRLEFGRAAGITAVRMMPKALHPAVDCIITTLRIKRWLQLPFDFDSTAILQPIHSNSTSLFDSATTIRRPTVRR